MNTLRTRRIRAVRALLRHAGAQACLVTDAVQLHWILGVPCESDQLLITRTSAFWYADARGVLPTFSEGRVRSFTTYKDDLRALRPGMLLVDADTTTVSQLYTLRAAVRGSRVRVRAVSRLLRDVRMMKSDQEQQHHARAASIADEALAWVRERVTVGMSEWDVAQLIERAMRTMGAEKPAFETIVAFGENAAVVHHRPVRTRLLRKTDPVLIDMGAVYKGAHSDMSRTYAPISYRSAAYQDQFERVWDAVYEAQHVGVEAVKHGVRARVVARACRDVLTASGFPDGFPHATGHGVGLQIHEAPVLSMRSNDVLAAGMIVTVEPGLYGGGTAGGTQKKNIFGVRIEDMMCVTSNSAQIYTQTPIVLEPFVLSPS